MVTGRRAVTGRQAGAAALRVVTVRVVTVRRAVTGVPTSGRAVTGGGDIISGSTFGPIVGPSAVPGSPLGSAGRRLISSATADNRPAAAHASVFRQPPSTPMSSSSDRRA